MAGQEYRKPSGSGPSTPGGLPGGQKQKEIKPTDASAAMDAFDGFEQGLHDAAMEAMSEEEKEEMAEDVDEEEGEGEEQSEDQGEDQDRKVRKDRYRCYCGNPTCTIAFAEGRQVKDPNGRFDQSGTPVVD